MRRSVYALKESAHSSFHQWNEQPGDRGGHRQRENHDQRVPEALQGMWGTVISSLRGCHE